MTVCIGLIAEAPDGRPVLIGITDRMITAGDIEYEPPRGKIYPYSNSVVNLTAGDSATHDDLGYAVLTDVRERIQAKPAAQNALSSSEPLVTAENS